MTSLALARFKLAVSERLRVHELIRSAAAMSGKVVAGGTRESRHKLIVSFAGFICLMCIIGRIDRLNDRFYLV